MMKLRFNCMECQIENNLSVYELYETEFNNAGYFSFTCQNGHKNTIFLQEMKFEVLFEIGANAILDGYYREAVSSFTSSLERFYEYCIKVLCLKNKIDFDKLNNAWKLVKTASERQFGAFVFLYLIEFKEQPTNKKDDDRWRHFRNDVIHNGVIPTKEQSIEYGEYILKYINNISMKLKNHGYSECMSQMIIEQRRNMDKNEQINKTRISTLSISTILKINRGDLEEYNKKDFIELLKSLDYEKARASRNHNLVKNV